MKTVSISFAALLPIALANAQASTMVGTPSSTGSSSGSVQTVQVGQGGLVFEPNSVTANEGDVIAFVIHTSHNVARSSFDSPCQPISGAQSIYSGSDLDDGTIFSVTVNDTNPIWLYCATGLHCEDGMSMVINPGSGDETLSAYQSAASSVVSSSAPDGVAGGVYGAPSDNGGDTSSSTSSTTAAGSSPTGSSSVTSRPAGSSTTTSSAPTTTTSNAASNLMADMMMVGGAILGGAVLIM